MKIKWEKRNDVQFRDIVRLQRETGLPKEICELYLSRGLKNKRDISDFINTTIKGLGEFKPIESLKNIVDKILNGISNMSTFTIYGDYDCDGTVGTAILFDYLKHAGAEVNYYIPNRKKEGYGLNKEAVKALKNSGTDIIITVDNGISSYEEVELINELGMDVIITDHHEPDLLLPETDYVLDFKNENIDYFNFICGAGVSLLLIEKLQEKLKLDVDIRKYEELVAIATIADIVELKGYNRDLVATVLNRLNQNEIYNQSLKELIKLTEIKDITPGTIGFRIAPIINAVGRLEDANKVVEFLTTKNSEEIKTLAENFYLKNRERQEIQSQLTDLALEIVEKKGFKNDNVIVLDEDNWNKGVIGIVASKIQEEFNKPVIIISKEGQIGHASCRSISGFNIYEGATRF